MPDRTLAEIAAELYAGPPGEFTAARDAAAKSETDKELASQIRRLRKPSVAAWVVNLFATERTAQLGDALQLAQELREAQEDLDAATLSALGRERRALTNRLADDAAELAEARGERITASTLEAVRQTLSAAFFDAHAAAAVASGRLVRELEPSADVDLAQVVAGGELPPPRTPEAPVDEVGERRARRDAERALRDAERTLERAERAQAVAERRHRSIGDRAEELAERIAALEEELASARAEEAAARRELAQAEERLSEGRKDVATAAARAEDARRALADLAGRSKP